MSLADIQKAIDQILAESWDPRQGTVVPKVDTVSLSNDTVQIDGAVMFSDLAHSTALVRDHVREFASHVIKVFLTLASRSIRDSGGEVRSFDGDRVMGVFTGNGYVENAVRAAFRLNGLMAREGIPRLQRRWNFNTAYRVAYGCGVDFGELHVIKAGVRAYNDLVFLGMPTINAAKLAQERVTGLPVLATARVYNEIHNTNLARTDFGQPLWNKRYSPKIKELIYASDAWVAVS